jgi:hypothetical protein
MLLGKKVATWGSRHLHFVLGPSEIALDDLDTGKQPGRV